MTNLMGMLVSVLSYEEEENFQPVVIQVLGPLSLVQVDNPPAAVCVPRNISKVFLNVNNQRRNAGLKLGSGSAFSNANPLYKLTVYLIP